MNLGNVIFKTPGIFFLIQVPLMKKRPTSVTTAHLLVRLFFNVPRLTMKSNVICTVPYPNIPLSRIP